MYAKVLNGDLDDDENEWDLDLGEDDLALTEPVSTRKPTRSAQSELWTAGPSPTETRNGKSAREPRADRPMMISVHDPQLYRAFGGLE